MSKKDTGLDRDSGMVLILLVIIIVITLLYLMEMGKKTVVVEERQAATICILTENESVRLRVGDKEAMVSIVPDYLGKESLVVEWELDSERQVLLLDLDKKGWHYVPVD